METKDLPCMGYSQFPKQFKEKLPCEISTLVQKFMFWDCQSLNKLEGVKQRLFSQFD